MLGVVFWVFSLEESISVRKRTASFLVQKCNPQQNKREGSAQLEKCERLCIQSKRTFSLRLFPHPKACQKNIKDWTDMILQLCSSHSHPCCELYTQTLTSWLSNICHRCCGSHYLQVPKKIYQFRIVKICEIRMYTQVHFSHITVPLWHLTALVVEPASLQIAS